MKFRFKSIKTRLKVWFLLVALLPLVLACSIISWQRVGVIKANVFDKLAAIRDLKAGEINFWLNERVGDVHAFSRIAESENIGAVLSGSAESAEGVKTRKNLAVMLSRIIGSYSDYSELFIVSGKSGKVVVSTESSREGEDVSGIRYFTEPLRTGEACISTIYESRTLTRYAMEFSAPIFRHSDSGKSALGVLVARIDLEHSVYPLLLNRTGLGNTGETLIVNRNVVALNELRWYTGAPLKLKIDATPALLASQGKTGVVEALDYRGEKVIAAYTYIPSTGWGFVAKMDLAEVYVPIRALLGNILILVLVVGAAALLLSAVLARSTTQPILDITEVAKRIREGDLTARNRISSTDEVGYLAESFNQATEAVALRIGMEKQNADLAETLILPKEVAGFARKVLEKFMAITQSQMGAFYCRREGEARFEPLAAIGVNAGLMEPFDAERFEGEFGTVLATGRMSHIRSIAQDTLFTFKTFAGTAVPREIITLPVMVDQEVRAMICLASLGGYSQAALTVMGQPAFIGLNTAFANLLANERTRDLVDALLKSNQKLQTQQEELEAQAEEMRQQSEELRSQNGELARQRLALEEAGRLKSQFLSNMSHELRTPLNSILALSRVLMMQATAKLSTEEVNYLDIIERNGKNLLTLINDILDLSRIEAGRMDVNPKRFSLRLTLDNSIESIAPIAMEKGIEIRKDIPGDLPLIESDEIRVSQILQNLIGNAVKFTDAGHVTVSARNDSGKISVRITDTGIGIGETDLPFIFDEFRQADGSSSRRHEGTGLGLAIARKAARMLGGEISVRSELGSGSVFTLTLPMVWQGTAPVYEPAVKQRLPVNKPVPRTVLVVDDDPAMTAMISRYLVQEGYSTITATSGPEALELAERDLPFAITLDIIMPEMDGWEVLQSLKENPVTRGIPVIIVSIFEERETGFALGAVGYVTKPVIRRQLLSEIEKIGKPGTRLIMIVDDNGLDRQAIRQIIEKAGLTAVEAFDGASCLELLERQIPDVLVLDLMMPEPDGFSVLERIRSNPETMDLPVIVVTAKDLTDEDRVRLTGNVFSVLEKTQATSETLLAEIKRILAGLEPVSKHSGMLRPAAAPRILIVDDNESVIIQVKSVLESAGFAADVARGGQEAFDYVSGTIPDGIILDLMVPEIDGFAVLEKIRGTAETVKIPVLILTAKDLTPEDFRKLSANNVQQLVQKGDINRDSLLFKVRSMVDRRVRVVREPATLLVVEDNFDNMTTVKAILQGRYRILEAMDGEQGLRLAEKELPDLILLDMALPTMDGFRVVRNLKDDKTMNSIPVIAMTAKVMKGDREKALEAGCDDYMAKPLDAERLLKMIESWLQKGQ
ncbi:MAG: response regulator [Pseudomonadota bacterium]